MSRLLAFFALRSDIVPVLEAVETSHRLTYAEAGLFETRDLTTFSSGVDIPDLGVAPSGDRNSERSYVVVDAGVEVRVREIHLRRGGVRYAVDQMANPEAVTLRPCGLFSSECVIAGDIGTCSEHPRSKSLFLLFAGHIRRRFVRVRSFWVGERALELLDSGGRLTMSVRSPALYDLRH